VFSGTRRLGTLTKFWLHNPGTVMAPRRRRTRALTCISKASLYAGFTYSFTSQPGGTDRTWLELRMLGNELGMQLIRGGKLVSYEAVPLGGSEMSCPVGRDASGSTVSSNGPWPPLGTWRTPAPTTNESGRKRSHRQPVGQLDRDRARVRGRPARRQAVPLARRASRPTNRATTPWWTTQRRRSAPRWECTGTGLAPRTSSRRATYPNHGSTAIPPLSELLFYPADRWGRRDPGANDGPVAGRGA
jgi:hypothetical protein